VATPRAPRAWDGLVLLAGVGVLAWLFFANALLASRVIDGTRYFWLDDDMMISMRYGRSLAEGHGLSWNPGDRVEGYTNFLWTLVMAGVHATGIRDAYAPAVVKAINFVLASGSLHLAMRLTRVFAPRSRLATLIVATCFVTCPDVVQWSVWGFETTLLGFLGLLFLVRVMTRGDDPLAYLALALVPLTRSDATYLFVAHAIVALAVSRDRRRTLAFLSLALVPAAYHLAFRRAYYGAWVPNTYDLKVFRVPDVGERGIFHARRFVAQYAAILALAAGSAAVLLRQDRRAVALFSGVLLTLGYATVVGGDMYPGFRFYGPVMPIVFAFAAAGVVAVTRSRRGGLAWAAVMYVVSVPLFNPFGRLIAAGTNGDCDRQLQVAMIVKRNALPGSTMAVLCAGVVPYFTHLRALDLAGKSDRHIARLEGVRGAIIGHSKVDPEYTLAQDPDLVVACSHGVAAVAGLSPATATVDPLHRFVASKAFQERYLPNPVAHDYLLRETAVFTHAGSPEYARRAWSGAGN
jgi:hypothetical protein